jgi:hypothetical protein
VEPHLFMLLRLGVIKKKLCNTGSDVNTVYIAIAKMFRGANIYFHHV